MVPRGALDLHRTSARPLGPPRPAQRTASTLMPRVLSNNGCVDPVAGATRAVSRAWHRIGLRAVVDQQQLSQDGRSNRVP
eukprot:scaffold132236_cov36-Phaeocystis_antarctica.AAC.1